MPGLIHEMRHVDHGQWIRAFEDQRAAHRNGAQRLLRAKHGDRTVQATQIKYDLSVGGFPRQSSSLGYNGKWCTHGAASAPSLRSGDGFSRPDRVLEGIRVEAVQAS